MVVLLNEVSKLPPCDAEPSWIFFQLLVKGVQVPTPSLTVIGLPLILQDLVLLDHRQVALASPLGLQGTCMLFWDLIGAGLFELEEGVEVGAGVEDGVVGLELLW